MQTTTIDQQGNFSSWVPIELLKGKDGKSTKMRIGGIASTASKDDDDEYLDPKGFDVDYFLSDGYLNWNHQAGKDPSAIIGKPTKAEITEKGLEIEGDLFENSEKAKQVYNLAEVLQSQGLNLGFSIEGKALKRGSDDEKDPAWKKVIKARITGCAITPNPKNKDAIATIIKGHSFNSLSAYEDKSEEETEKAMEAGSASGQAISKESLDGDLKVTTFKSNNDQPEKKFLTKGEVYVKLFTNDPQLDGISADRLYKLMQKIENMKNDEVEKVSEESFNKALDVINGLEKGTKAAPMKKESGEDDKEKEDLEKAKKMKKAEDEEEEEDEDDEEEGSDMSKSISPEQIEAATLILESVGFSIIEKGKESDLNKGVTNDLEPEVDIDVLVKGLKSDLEKSIRGEFAEQLNAIPALGTLVKGLNNKLGDLLEKVDLIGKNSAGPKSVIKADVIEKSFANEGDLEKGATEGKKLSISQHKQALLNDLEKSYLSEKDGKTQILNEGLAKDTMIYESSNQVSKSIIDHFNQKGIQLVP